MTSTLTRRDFMKLAGAGVAGAAFLGACGGQSASGLQQVKVGMSAFQDVSSVYVGIEKGFYKEAGIELEIQPTDWSGANELLIGRQVDIANSTETDVMLQNAQGHGTTLAFPYVYFAGSALSYDPNQYDWKTFDDFMEETNGDRKEAIRRTLEQFKGKKVGVSAGGGEFATFIGLLDFAGLDKDDYQIVDLAQEELPPALLSNSVDVMMAGIPQRLAVLDRGYASLMDQTALPSTITHVAFAAHRDWVEKNPKLSTKIQKVIFKTLDYIEKHPDEAFPIISKKQEEAGSKVTTEALKGVWNKMEFFPSSEEWFQEKVLSPDGRFYWRDRFEAVLRDLKATGKIKGDLKVPLEDLHYAKRVVLPIKD